VEPRAIAAQERPSLLRTVATVVWQRRWKLLATAFGYALVKSCDWGPEWLQPACELLAMLAKVLP